MAVLEKIPDFSTDPLLLSLHLPHPLRLSEFLLRNRPMSDSSPDRILGVDPGSLATGIGIVEAKGAN